MTTDSQSKPVVHLSPFVSILLVVAGLATFAFGAYLSFSLSSATLLYTLVGLFSGFHYFFFFITDWRSAFSFSLATAHGCIMLALAGGNFAGQYANHYYEVSDATAKSTTWFPHSHFLLYSLGQHFRIFLVGSTVLLLVLSSIVYYTVVRPERETERLMNFSGRFIIINRFIVFFASLVIIFATFFPAFYKTLQVPYTLFTTERYTLTVFPLNVQKMYKYAFAFFAASTCLGTVSLVRPASKARSVLDKCARVISSFVVGAGAIIFASVIYISKGISQSQHPYAGLSLPLIAIGTLLLLISLLELLLPQKTVKDSNWESHMDPYSSAA